MSTFVNLQYSNEHPGVHRVESAIEGARQLRKSWSATRGLAALLLAAMVAAVLVVAYQVMDNVAEGHLLVLWLALWATAFAAMALLTGSARSAVRRASQGLDRLVQRQAAARADARLWAIARTDARVMADLQSAITRNQSISR